MITLSQDYEGVMVVVTGQDGQWFATLYTGDWIDTREFDVPGGPWATYPEARKAAHDLIDMEIEAEVKAEAQMEEALAASSCRWCGGPDDHGIDCLPASQGGTQPDVVRVWS